MAFAVALIIATSTAWRLRRVAPAHNVVFIALSLGLLADACRSALFAFETGLLLRRSLFLAFPSISAWCAVAAVWPNRSRIAAIYCGMNWISACSVLAFFNPPQGSVIAEHVAFSARLLAVGVEAVVLALFLAQRTRPTFTQMVAFVLVAGDCGELAGPWAWASAWRAWDLARIQWAGVYLLVAVMQHLRLRWINFLLAQLNASTHAPR